MKKITLVAALVGVSYFSNAQVGIGTPTPATSSQLDIVAKDKGVLIPRVGLTNTTTFFTGGTQVESLLVYNTAKVGDVIPGFYYWVKESATTPHWERIVNQTQLDEAIANISNMQADLDKVLALLKVAFPSNNLVAPATSGDKHGGGMVYTPATTSPAAPVKIEYVYFDNTSQTYVKKDITADILDLIKGVESRTTILEYPTDSGKFYYISEETIQENNGVVPTTPFSSGTTLRPGIVYLDVPESVIKNFETILDGRTTIVKPGTTNEYFTVEEYIKYLSVTSGANVGYTVTAIIAADNGGVAIPANSLYYINQAGNKVVIDLSSIVKANETKTFFRKITNATNENAQYLYFSEEAIQTWLAADSANTVANIPNTSASITIDAVGDVVNNFESILKQTTVYKGDTVTIEKIINEIAGKVDGNVIYKNIAAAGDPANWVFQYWDGTKYETINLGDIVKANETKTKIVTIENKQFYLAEDFTGVVPTTIPTTLPTGMYAIDVIGGIVNNFNELVKNNKVVVGGKTYNSVEEYIQYLSETSDANVGYTVTAIAAGDNGGVAIPANSLYYINQAGNKVVIDFGSIVKANETNTTLVKSDITNLADPIVYTYANENFLKGVAGATESKIEITADMVTSITNNTDVQNAISKFLNQGGNVFFTRTAIAAGTPVGQLAIPANSFYTVDTNGVKVLIDLADLVAGLETKTRITRAVDATDKEVIYSYAHEANKPNANGISTVGTPDVLNVTEDVLYSITNNGDVIDAITNILKQGGNVFFGDHDGDNTTADVLYTVIAGVNTPIDISGTVLQVITNNVENIKNILGDNINNTTVVKTGDTFKGGDVYIFTSTTSITHPDTDATMSAITSGITIPNTVTPSSIIGIKVIDSKGIASNVTDIVITGQEVKFNIGTGNTYTTLPVKTGYNVIVEFVGTVTP